MSAMTAIHRNPSADWNVRSLADHATLSPSRLTARFRATLGESPMSYVARWRMILAGQLLIDTTTQIQQISLQVGYTSQPSFSRAFHRAHGCSPRQFRSNHLGAAHTTRPRVNVGDPSAKTSGVT
jgi:AraC-like DNA-binding protein